MAISKKIIANHPILKKITCKECIEKISNHGKITNLVVEENIENGCLNVVEFTSDSFRNILIRTPLHISYCKWDGKFTTKIIEEED